MADVDYLADAKEAAANGTTPGTTDDEARDSFQYAIACALIDIAESLRALAPKPWENQ